ncbi:MAG: EamA family transporter [Firmicutes bacterium]|nr:EamA family transporter [Bacillota bacterium]
MNFLKSPIVLLGISILLGIGGQFLFKHGLNKLTGSTPFQLSHLKNPATLMNRLKEHGDPVSGYVYEQLSPESKKMLSAYNSSGAPSDELQKSIVGDLNRLMQDAALYNKDRFSGVDLTDKIKNDAAKNPTGKDLAALNRKLLQEAYPDELLPAGIELTPKIVFLFFTPHIFLGLCLYVLSTFSWLSALSKVPLSFAYPMLSTGYLLIFVIGILFLGEKFTYAKLFANLLIIAGISLLFTGKN